MLAEAAAYALLAGAGAITAIVGTRIYPVQVPLAQPAPAIAYELISAVTQGALDASAPTHLTRSRVRVNLLGGDYDTLRTLRTAVVTALRHQRGTFGGTEVHAVFLDYEGPVSFDQPLNLYTRPVDFIFLHQQ